MTNMPDGRIEVGSRWCSRDGKRAVTVLSAKGYDCVVRSDGGSRWFIRETSLRRMYVPLTALSDVEAEHL